MDESKRPDHVIIINITPSIMDLELDTFVTFFNSKEETAWQAVIRGHGSHDYLKEFVTGTTNAKTSDLLDYHYDRFNFNPSFDIENDMLERIKLYSDMNSNRRMCKHDIMIFDYKIVKIPT
jgi:hypothetical protein